MNLEKFKKYCISEHREMWLWLSENPDKEKRDWPGWKYHNDNNFDPTKHQHCFLCGYVSVAYEEESCHACPLDWGISESCEDGIGQSTYYEKYCDAKMHTHRAKYAKIIANLPEKDELNRD